MGCVGFQMAEASERLSYMVNGIPTNSERLSYMVNGVATNIRTRDHESSTNGICSALELTLGHSRIYSRIDPSHLFLDIWMESLRIAC